MTRRTIETGLRQSFTTDLTKASWRKSSHSNGQSNCVEVATNLVADDQPGIVAVRDSKDRTGPVLVLTPAQWRTFTARLCG
jgi:hypothetical protein